MNKLNLNCPINSTGYGITSLNIMKALSLRNIDISLFPIGQQIECNNEQEQHLIKKLLDNNNIFSYKAPCLKIWHQHDLALKVGCGHYYTFPFFEIDKLTNREIHHLNYSDFIFVASDWGKKILLKNNIHKPIYVVPLGVDRSIFSIRPNKIRIKKPNYIFFHIGKWEHRKSQDIILDAFSKAFDSNDDVELYLLPYNPFLNETEYNYWLNLVKNCKLNNKIKIFNRLQDQYQVASFIENCDCGVFVSRAEGWNNEILESMSMDKPVIVTNYSAHTEYCDINNAYLIDIDETEPANDGKWFNGHGNWAKIGDKQIEQLIVHMRYVYHNHKDSNPNGVVTSQKYSWDNTAKIIDSVLSQNGSYNANTKTRKKRR